MKKIIFLVAWLISSRLAAQVITVRDNSSREVLPNVLFKDKNEKSLSTDNTGKIDISALDKSGDITIYHSSYLPHVLTEDEKSGKVSEIRITTRTVVLDEIVLSANRQKEHKIDVPYTINVIHQKEIEFANQATSADLLQNTGAVFVQKSQMGGGSPILRGFEANKTLIVVDGVRMNNAIYRAGHLQDVISLDANMLERTEVLFGPSSTVYGSDALGGVMHFYTKNAEFSYSEKMFVKANAFMRYASANQEKTGHLDFNLGWKNFASITNITLSDFGDLMSGNTNLAGTSATWDRDYFVKRFGDRDSMVKNSNNNLQVGTAYSQLDMMQRFNFRTGEFLTHNLNLQYSQSSDIPRYDRLTEYSGSNLKYAEWNYGPQKRLLVAYTLNYSKKNTMSDNIKLITAFQKLDQDRISRRFGNNNRSTQMEDIKVGSINIDAFKLLKEEHELRYGAELQANKVVSTANALQIVSGAESPAATRYADGGNKMNTIGVYISHAWEVTKNFVITDGLRFTANTLESKFKDTLFFKAPYSVASQKNSAVTGNLGFTWKEDNNYKVSLFANTGFRTPNIDDMSKLFESGGNIMIVPNENLKPEYATNFELSLSKVVDSKFKFDFTAFYTLLDNALVLSDYKYNGQDSVTVNGSRRKVQAMQNKNRAYIYGFTGGVQFDFNPHISFKSIINYTYGRYEDLGTDTVLPLDHIPPVFGQTSLMFKEKNTDAEFFVRYQGIKSSKDYSTSGEDNAQYSADQKNGYMPAWFTLNIRVGYNITRNLRVNASCENLTDNRYRVFASGVNAPGRNFIFSLRYKM